MLLASTCPSAQAEIESAQPQESQSGQQCEAGEQVLFAGDVEDEFGLGIAVCQAGETLTVRYSGEGDPQALSCRIGECTGVIEFDHYVRYRFTVLTLTWRDVNGQQRLVETFDAQDEAKPPVHLVHHTWRPPSSDAAPASEMTYPVKAKTQPLALLALSHCGSL